MTRQVQEAYIVAATRSPVGKAPRGMFRNVRPDDMLAHVLKAAMERCPGLDPAAVEDVIVGCAMPEAEQGMNVARIGLLLAGFPDSVPGMTINRFCSSGTQAVALAADRIRLGEADVMIAAGTESMSMVPMGGNKPSFNPAIFDKDENVAIAYGMGITAERVAARWKITREAQDMYAADSHRRAIHAIDTGEFRDEVAPYNVVEHLPDLAAGEVKTVSRVAASDEGPRRDTSPEALARLKTRVCVQRQRDSGKQLADVRRRGRGGGDERSGNEAIQPHSVGRFVTYVSRACRRRSHGIGPVKAIPKALARRDCVRTTSTGSEFNEAFAAQTLAVIGELGLDREKVSPLGGAIALGHPLGATGAIRVATLMHGLRRHKKKYGMVTMCIGTGMGAAGIFEAL